MTDSVLQQKKVLRQALLAKRQLVDPRTWVLKSQALTGHLATWIRVHSFTQILAFMPIRGEPDLTQLPDLLPHLTFGWPVVPDVGHQLSFHTWRPGEALRVDRFGVKHPIPSPESKLTLSPLRATLVLVPALAVDHKGFRLGYGGGFYDRFLAMESEIKTVAVLFSDFLLGHLPLESHDLAVHHVATELGVIQVV